MVRGNLDPMHGFAKAAVVVFQEFYQAGKFSKKQASIYRLCTAQCPKKP